MRNVRNGGTFVSAALTATRPRMSERLLTARVQTLDCHQFQFFAASVSGRSDCQ